MRGDESELKAAGEKAKHQENVGTMTEGFPERALHGLLFAAFGVTRGRRRHQRKRHRHAEKQKPAENDKRGLPALVVDQSDAEGREQKLPERAGAGAEAEREPAPFRLQELPESREHNV